MNGFFTTNTMLWVAQISLACILFYASFSMAFPRRGKALPGAQEPVFACDGMPCMLAWLLALLEFTGALCLIVPVDFWPANLLPRVAASVLAALILVTGIHHVRHKQPTAPIVAVFFLALFILVGRWP
ncbi:MAG: hypothetical protein ACLQHF_03990 [Terracidiphilus sp.]